MSKTGRTTGAHENDVSGTPAPQYNRDTKDNRSSSRSLRESCAPRGVPCTYLDMRSSNSTTRILSGFCGAAVIALSPDDQS
jgi:hypothetical protein